ncbi:MAG: hypothetical protein ACTSPD_11705 [Promethearchaeota archaeon]
MEEIAPIITAFCELLKEEIFEYYNRYYSYLKDLFTDKKIDLKFKTSYENKKTILNTIETMIKTTKIALSTIGVSKNRIYQVEKYFKGIVVNSDYEDYNSYFENDIKVEIDKILFEILIEYIIDLDTNKIDNLDLFDLLPRKFINKLDQFRDDYIISTHLKRIINNMLPEIHKIVDPSKLIPISKITEKVLEGKREAPKEIIEEKEIEKPIREIKKVKEKAETISDVEEVDETILLKQLELAKKENIEALKKSIKSSIKATESRIKEPSEMKIFDSKISIPKSQMPTTKPIKEPIITPTISSKSLKTETTAPKEVALKVEKPTQEISVPKGEPTRVEPLPDYKVELKTYLEYFGNFFPIDASVRAKFNINLTNLINLGILNQDFFDLENLFYYISIFKMLDVSFPINKDDILTLTKKYINGKTFSLSKETPPDPISIFYGLAIFSELNLLNNNKVIDLLDIEMFLESELKNFLPEKLHLNFYTLMCFKLIERNGGIITDKNHLLNPMLSLSLANLENYIPVIDIYEQVASIKLIDYNADLSHFKALYAKDLKQLITSNGAVNDTITDSARTLLTFKLLDLDKQEYSVIKRLIKYITSSTNFFYLDNINKDFNWQSDKIGFTIELRMLFWALLASSQYSPII